MQPPACEPLDCAVIGAGPAGLTAALYLRRFHRRVAVLDDGRSRAQYIDRSHNLPGFPQGLPGRTFLRRLRRQLQAVGGHVTAGHVSALQRLPQGGFRLALGPDMLQARTVILASGVVDGQPALPGLVQVHARGLLRQCPICDGHEHRGQHIGVLGDGDHAEREARFIAHYSPHVWRIGLQAPAARRADERARVQALPSPARQMSVGDDGRVQVQLHDGSMHAFDVLYAALGAQPRSRLARSIGARLDAQGGLEVDARCSTSVPGLYAVGDVVSGLDQLAVATGHGALAATAVHNRLQAEADADADAEADAGSTPEAAPRPPVLHLAGGTHSAGTRPPR